MEDKPKKKNIIQRGAASLGRYVTGRAPPPGQDRGDPNEFLTEDEEAFFTGKKKKKKASDELADR